MSRRIALAAIVRNELEYLVEWIAWHRVAGFTDFFIADNRSDDGTLELLRRLERAGVIRLHLEPQGVGAQVKAYNKMLQLWGRSVERIAFLDADEFLVLDGEGRPVDYLEDLISPPDVGAIAINWRLFGSAGQQQREAGLVIERFTRCAVSDAIPCRNIKTYAKPHAVVRQRIHRCELARGMRYLDISGGPVRFARPGTWEPDANGDASCEPAGEALRVHHYAVKSLQEYVEKKQLRGDAMSGARDRGMSYFRFLDRNEVECRVATSKLGAVRREMAALEAVLRGTRLRYP